MIARRIIIALLMSLVGSAVFTFWLSHKFLNKQPHVEVPKVNRYVALSKGLEAGETLTATSLKIVDWPLASPIEGAFVKPEQVLGRTLLYPLSEGEPILERQLSVAGSGIGLAYKIPEGMRAISLRSDQIVGVAGFLLPGTHVDVLVTYHTQESPNPITETVLQDVQILAAGQNMQPTPDGKAATTDVVTLLVNPDDAQRVVLASAQGTVHFVLRNGSDHKVVAGLPLPISAIDGVGSMAKAVPVANIKSSSVISMKAQPKESTPTAPKPYTVQVVYGGNKENAQ